MVRSDLDIKAVAEQLGVDSRKFELWKKLVLSKEDTNFHDKSLPLTDVSMEYSPSTTVLEALPK